MRFQNQVAVITAAGAGIGKATAEIMVQEGATVIAIDVDNSRLAALTEALASATGTLIPKMLDAADQSLVRGAVAEISESQGHIDILVNAVGGSTIIASPAATVDELSFEDWQKVIDFNLNATFLFCNNVVPLMKQAGHGKIINLASIAGRGLSGASSSAYAAAKGGIIAFTRKLANELGPSGINVNAIAPGVVDGEHWDGVDAFFAKHEGKAPGQKKQEVGAAVPYGRMGTAEDLTGMAIFLASDEAEYIVAQCYNVDGGQWMS